MCSQNCRAAFVLSGIGSLSTAGLRFAGADQPQRLTGEEVVEYALSRSLSPALVAQYVSVSHLTGVTPRSEKNITMFKAESYVGHKICRPGDLAINTMWAWMAALGISTHEGIISPAYGVYRQRLPQRLLGSFADLLLRTQPYTSNYMSRSTGVRASRLRLYPEEFFRISIILPPLEEQSQIVDSITIETQSRNTAIARTEREIALMQEYRTRLTSDIVTGKLDVRDAAAKLPDPSTDTTPEPIADEALEEIETEES